MRGYKPINLQLFAEEKTEKATPKKRKDAREKGDVLKSTELNSTVVLLAGLLGMKIWGPKAVERLKAFMVSYLSGEEWALLDLTAESAGSLALQAMISFILTAGPFMLTVLAAGLAINLIQTGFLFTGKTLGFKFSRINPLEGIKRLFSARNLVQLLKSIIKTVVIGFTVYKGFMDSLAGIPGVMQRNLLSGSSFMIKGILDIAMDACIVFAIISIADYLYEWWMHEKSLRMTKQEVKEEVKQMEGNPQIKGRIRSKQRQMAMARMMQQVPHADVVITNPTHYAAALKYEDKSRAPVVVAKGKDHMALRIRKIAQEHNVHIVENRPLAQSLYRMVEVGEEIPVELYKAVAEILAYVYRLKNQ